MSDIYCGAKDIPNGKKLGSMKQCVEKGQISYYGVKKVDSKLLEKHMGSKKEKKDAMKVLMKMAEQKGTLSAKLNKLKKSIEAERDNKKLKALEKQKEELQIKFKEVVKLFNEANKKTINRQQSLKRQSSRRHSSRRQSSRRQSSRQ
jgi:hypothetical protein